MGRDRLAAEMVQAHAAGIIDFAKIDPNSSKDILRINLLLKETRRQRTEKKAFVYLLRGVAAMTTSKTPIEGEQNKDICSFVGELVNEYISSLLPVDEEVIKRDKDEVLAEETTKWEKTFNCKIDGPEVAAAVAHMQALLETSKQQQLAAAEEAAFIAGLSAGTVKPIRRRRAKNVKP